MSSTTPMLCSGRTGLMDGIIININYFIYWCSNLWKNGISIIHTCVNIWRILLSF